MHGSRRHIIMHRHERVAAAAQACGCHKVCQRSSAGASRLHGMAHIGEAVVDETRRMLQPAARPSEFPALAASHVHDVESNFGAKVK